MKIELNLLEMTFDQRKATANFLLTYPPAVPPVETVKSTLQDILNAPKSDVFKAAYVAGATMGMGNTILPELDKAITEEQRLDGEQKADLASPAAVVGCAAALNPVFPKMQDAAPSFADAAASLIAQGDTTVTTSPQPIAPPPPTAPHVPPVPTVAPATGSHVQTDSEGLPWDHRIHASTKTFIADGTWKLKRGVDAAEVVMVKEQLKALMCVPTFVAVVNPDRVPFAPVISAPPAPPPAPTSHYLINQVPPTVTLADLIARMSAAIVAGKMTQAVVAEMCTKHGVSEFMLLSSRPDLLPLIDADMRALGV